MGAVLRVLYLNILLNFVIIKVLLGLRPLHFTFCVRYSAYTSWTTCAYTRICLGAKATQDVLNFVGVPLNCELSPHLEYDGYRVLHSSAYKK